MKFAPSSARDRSRHYTKREKCDDRQIGKIARIDEAFGIHPDHDAADHLFRAVIGIKMVKPLLFAFGVRARIVRARLGREG